VLTADLAISRRRGATIVPIYLDPSDRAILASAESLIAILRDGVGSTRREIDSAFDEMIGEGTDYRVLRGMIKLLLDRSRFETSGVADPAELRGSLFLAARASHPVVAHPGARDRLLGAEAKRLGVSPDAIVGSLYGDVPANQRLVEHDEPSARELVDAYNLAQAQALLYRAVRMAIRVAPQEARGYRRLFDAIKAHRLVHTIHGDAASGYAVELDGPVSLFHRSQKYGIQMAAFLPSLLGCHGWEMRAEIDAKPRGPAFFELTSEQTRLRDPRAFDVPERHPVVEKLVAAAMRGASEWKAAFADEIVDLGETVFVPDVAATHSSTARVLVEVVGFWTPRSIVRRADELARAGLQRFLLIASDELRASREPLDGSQANVFIFKTSPESRALRAALDAILEQGIVSR
jgi:predicted nuclease of restriction endonuclease-like RecB superfamily